MSDSPSPFTKPTPGLRIVEGAPAVKRPTKEEIENFPKEAEELIHSNKQSQEEILRSKNYQFDSLKGKHFLLAGATGPGLGGAFATAVLDLVKEGGSVTILSRDLKKSLGFETGNLLSKKAEELGLGNRFHWLNDGMVMEGDKLDKIVDAIKEAGADKVIYVNTVAAAISGLLPDHPPVFVKDVDEEGLFQWELKPISEKEIDITKTVMGTMAVDFPKVLESKGIVVEATLFADWRGSIDKISRDPSKEEYGRQGAYSTSLYLPKDSLQKAASEAYGRGKIVLDIFYPIMRTRALGFIPGGNTMGSVYEKLMKKAGVDIVGIPELALQSLDILNSAFTKGMDNPFPRLDMHEADFELWFFEVVKRLTDDESSDFYYKKWID